MASKVKAALQLEPTANLIFVHRDSDDKDPECRHMEIKNALAPLQVPPCIRVVPVQELESWLLLDEAEIRRVAENPTGRVALKLPSAHSVERIARPKEVLKDTILAASETTGRRRQRLAMRFDDQRRLLLQRLDPRKHLQDVPAWERLKKDVGDVMDTLLHS